MTEDTGTMIVSDHAIVRYLERVACIPRSSIEREILSPELEDVVKQLGDGTYPVNGFRVVVEDNTVVTILT